MWAEFEATIWKRLPPDCSGSGSVQNSAACVFCGRMLASAPLMETTGIPVLSMATPRITRGDSFSSITWLAPAPEGAESTIVGGAGGAAGLGSGGGAATGWATTVDGAAGGFTSARIWSKSLSASEIDEVPGAFSAEADKKPEPLWILPHLS